MEIPSKNEAHLDVITTGVESEEVEEVNDAYKDILEELGEKKKIQKNSPKPWLRSGQDDWAWAGGGDAVLLSSAHHWLHLLTLL